MDNSVYQKHGYKNRVDYLKSLAREYYVPLFLVFELAEVLGESEDFDGLLSSIQDYKEMGGI